ncbi:MAG: hypothetical protein JRG94_13220 [Deltaproteobacteria bacterium]|nr:hypothetical protein [Deltaproteobacteria bacterium]
MTDKPSNLKGLLVHAEVNRRISQPIMSSFDVSSFAFSGSSIRMTPAWRISAADYCEVLHDE